MHAVTSIFFLFSYVISQNKLQALRNILFIFDFLKDEHLRHRYVKNIHFFLKN